MTKSNIKLPTYCFINIGTGVYQEHILKSLKKKVFLLYPLIFCQMRKV